MLKAECPQSADPAHVWSLRKTSQHAARSQARWTH